MDPRFRIHTKMSSIRNPTLVLGIKSNGGGTLLQMYPTAYWKVQEDDTPARTVKTIVHTLVKVSSSPIVCVSDPDSIRSEGFFCSLDVLYGVQGIGKLQFLIKKIYLKNFLAVNLDTFLVIKTLDPDRYSA
jgi:hypothetical protein